ncbi:MAG: AAA family ATPase [Rhizomicrobium sp.]|jgi:flagellar biosynthesis protein FlhF
MQLRTFLAKDMREALASVRNEMGPEAVIVASERAKGGGIMVRAALDAEEIDAGVETAARELAAALNPPAPSFETSYRDGLIRRLRGERPVATPNGIGFDRAELLTLLRAHRAPDGLAHALAEAAEKSGLADMTLALASALDKRMRTNPLTIESATALLLAGPPGAGKTAVAAKIAAHARLSGREIELIAGDVTGAGAIMRLETFAKHVGARFVTAETTDALAKTIAECATKNILSVVDTAGFDPRNAKARTAYAALAHMEGVEAIGVVAATNDAEETAEITTSLVTLGVKRMIVTGLDLARRAGAVLAAAAQGADLAHVTRSPFVAGGLETLTPLSLARLLIESHTGGADRGSAQ